VRGGGEPGGGGGLAAARKRDKRDADGYAAMIASTTRLNTPGPDLAAIDGVHAMTDVTGFGLGGHGLEMAKGSGLDLVIDWNAVPLLPGVRDLAAQGMITGASARNWTSYGEAVSLPDLFPDVERALLTDPQTSGGLLVSCAPEAVDDVMACFRRHGFDAAAQIGRVVASDTKKGRLVVTQTAP